MLNLQDMLHDYDNDDFLTDLCYHYTTDELAEAGGLACIHVANIEGEMDHTTLETRPQDP